MNRFVKHILFTDLILLGAGVLPLYFVASTSHALAALAALIFTSTYTLVGTMLTNRYFHAGHKEFMSNVFGRGNRRLLGAWQPPLVVLEEGYASRPEITFTVRLLISVLLASFRYTGNFSLCSRKWAHR